MTRNPSRKQRIASARNIRGKEGPKTVEGKARSAANGRLNRRGIPLAKTLAKAIAHNLKHDSQSFYSHCLTCQKECQWPSFSIKTSLENFPIGCLEEVVRKEPARCFYYFQGLCCAPIATNLGPESIDCILEPGFHRGSEDFE